MCDYIREKTHNKVYNEVLTSHDYHLNVLSVRFISMVHMLNTYSTYCKSVYLQKKNPKEFQCFYGQSNYDISVTLTY